MNDLPLVFDVQGSPVVGVLHRPETPPQVGILMVAAGGPQYHVGCARQLLSWGRALSQAGFAVLRFDYRGMGDSGGEFKGFEQIDVDLKAAIDQLLEQQPSIKKVVLWGGCNAASAIMIYAWQDKRVDRIIVSNPWAHTEATEARLQVKYYYLQRLSQKTFWLKLLRGNLNIVQSWRSLAGALQKMGGNQPQAAVDSTVSAESNLHFVERMRLGLERYSGTMLLLLSGQSAMGREFDETVSASRSWQQTVAKTDITRIEMPEAEHTFSTRESQRAVLDAVLTWLDGAD
tara:strand:+ start:19696 stop:20559 length:864 start_codon:yes stop_codon:yes gene_type:complete